MNHCLQRPAAMATKQYVYQWYSSARGFLVLTYRMLVIVLVSKLQLAGQRCIQQSFVTMHTGRSDKLI